MKTETNKALIEALFVEFINANAEKIKGLAAFQKLTKEELMKLEREYLASIAA